MEQNFKNLTIAELSDIEKFYLNEYDEVPGTEYVRFCNNTHDFTVEVFLYEVRQKRNLPPPRGYSEWTGVTVGGKDIGRGECRTAYLQKKVIGDFSDAGLLNIKHVPTGRVQRTFNFKDRIAPPGKYFRWVKFSIVQNKVISKGRLSITLEITGELSDGELVRQTDEQIFKLD